MSNQKLLNIFRVSILYAGCMLINIILEEMDISSELIVSISIIYFIAVVTAEKFEIFTYFKGISIPSGLAYACLFAYHYGFENSVTELVRFFTAGLFLISCGYLIYRIHVFKHEAKPEIDK